MNLRFYSLSFENQAEFLIKLVQAEMTLKDMGITASLGAYTNSYQSHKNFVDFCNS